MRKVIAAINMTIDGFCDPTAIIPDEKIHQHSLTNNKPNNQDLREMRGLFYCGNEYVCTI